MNKFLRLSSVTMAAVGLLAMSLGAETAAAAGPERDISGITRKVYPSVVRVEARNSVRRVATGVVIDKDGTILTTALISPRDEEITITTGDGKRSGAEFLGFDSETHLALVRAKDKGLTPIAMGDPEDVGPGSWVCVVSISPEMTAAVTQGIVSSVSEQRLRLNIWVTPGSSGGPVVDENGRMVGLLRGVYTEDRPVLFEFRDKEQVGSGYVLSRGEAPSSGMAIAVPMDIVGKVAREIKETGKVRRGWLGVSVAENDEEKVEVIGIDEESPAEFSKIKEGDILVKIGDKDITGGLMMSSEIRKRKPGDDVVLKIERDGKTMDVKVKLGEYPEEAAKREMELKFPRLFPPEGPITVLPGEPAPKTPKALAPRKGRAFGWEKRKYVGVYLEELNKEMSAYFGVKEGIGLLVNKLTEKGPAEKAGLKVGDVILKADGKRIETAEELSRLVQDQKTGDKLKIEILREKKAHTFEITVEEEELGDTLRWSEPFGNLGNEARALGESARVQMRELNQEMRTAVRTGKTAAGNFARAFKRLVTRI
jgi:serine protease Do